MVNAGSDQVWQSEVGRCSIRSEVGRGMAAQSGLGRGTAVPGLGTAMLGLR